MSEQKEIWISYSQIKTFFDCAFRWKLLNIDKIKLPKVEDDERLIGIVFHSIFEKIIKNLFEQTTKDFKFQLEEIITLELSKYFLDEIKKEKFLNEIKEIILNLLKEIKFYINIRNSKLIGTEVELKINLKDNVYFVGYVDLIIQDLQTQQIKIFDLKITQSGWSKANKNDFFKKLQLLYYKIYYSKLFNINFEKIETYFLIIRKMFKKNIIDIHEVNTNNSLIKKANEYLEKFLSFINDPNFVYLKNPSEKNCRYCEFNNTEYCDKINH